MKSNKKKNITGYLSSYMMDAAKILHITQGHSIKHSIQHKYNVNTPEPPNKQDCVVILSFTTWYIWFDCYSSVFHSRLLVSEKSHSQTIHSVHEITKVYWKKKQQSHSLQFDTKYGWYIVGHKKKLKNCTLCKANKMFLITWQ